jgi:hypothetical protein
MCYEQEMNNHIYYKQMFGKFKDCFTVVEVLLWIDDKVLLEEVKSGLRYVLSGDEFLQFHETLSYECEASDYNGANLGRILDAL